MTFVTVEKYLADSRMAIGNVALPLWPLEGRAQPVADMDKISRLSNTIAQANAQVDELVERRSAPSKMHSKELGCLFRRPRSATGNCCNMLHTPRKL